MLGAGLLEDVLALRCGLQALVMLGRARCCKLVLLMSCSWQVRLGMHRSGLCQDLRACMQRTLVSDIQPRKLAHAYPRHLCNLAAQQPGASARRMLYHRHMCTIDRAPLTTREPPQSHAYLAHTYGHGRMAPAPHTPNCWH